MRIGLGLLGIGAAMMLQGCQAQSVSMADTWRAQCASLGHEAGTSEMAGCVSTMRRESEADRLSAVAIY